MAFRKRDSNGRFLPGGPGGPGRPRKRPALTEVLGPKKTAEVAQIMFEKLKEEGDTKSGAALLRLLYRRVPRLPSLPVLDLPNLKNAESVEKYMSQVAEYLHEGQLEPEQAELLFKLANSFAEANSWADLERDFNNRNRK